MRFFQPEEGGEEDIRECLRKERVRVVRTSEGEPVIRALLGWAPRGPCKPPTTPTKKEEGGGEEVANGLPETSLRDLRVGTYRLVYHLKPPSRFSLQACRNNRPTKTNPPPQPRARRVIIKYLSRLGIVFHRVDAPADFPYCVSRPSSIRPSIPYQPAIEL